MGFSDLRELINSVDIVDYISQFVELTEKNGEYWGLSPFKDEKTPSFSVRRETGRFYDFSSGIGGNVFTFIRYYYKCTGLKAVQILESYVGKGAFSPESKLYASAVCKKFKPEDKPIKQKKTAEYHKDCMRVFEKPAEKLAVWENEGISKESLEKFEVHYDKVSDRLVYPIRDLSGKIVNIGGRTLDAAWKEKGLRKYTYFSGWNEMNVIYGVFENLREITEKKEVIIFEGAKSVMLADSYGIHNCGALLTSHLSPAQRKILIKLGCNVVFALDKEINIHNDRNIAKLKSFVNVYYYIDRDNLLSEKDAPVDKGREVFLKLYNEKIRLS